MATVNHKDLTDPNIHESKGVASAAADTMYVADGAGSGAWKLRLKRYTATITPAIVNANTTSEQTFTVTGVVAATDDVISVRKPTHQAGLGLVNWRVTADNTIAITFMNNTAAGITPTASEVYSFFVYRT
jgi:hypothetical protein